MVSEVKRDIHELAHQRGITRTNIEAILNRFRPPDASCPTNHVHGAHMVCGPHVQKHGADAQAGIGGPDTYLIIYYGLKASCK
jgi:hypothetical protein